MSEEVKNGWHKEKETLVKNILLIKVIKRQDLEITIMI